MWRYLTGPKRRAEAPEPVSFDAHLQHRTVDDLRGLRGAKRERQLILS